MQYCYRLLGIDFPERGFLLFWQLPLNDKLQYFKIEDEIIELKGRLSDDKKRKKELYEILGFLGANPVEKVDKAFKKKYTLGIMEYLGLTWGGENQYKTSKNCLKNVPIIEKF